MRLAIAALIGLGAGLEREWSGHTTGPAARFAGLRTFLLLGTLGGVAGLLISVGAETVGAMLIAGGMALAVGAYVVTSRRPEAEVEGTTEAAAIAVVALGALAGYGWMSLAAGAGSLLVLALREKSRLHWLVRRVGERELRAALQFAVLALVILPLLPAGPFGGALAIRPRALWTIVLFFSALNFAGFLARRAVGPHAGYTVTGVLGGLLSSTAVTLEFSRRSRHEPELGVPLAQGVVGACTVLFPRIVIVSAVLNVAVARRLAVLLAAPALAGAVLMLAWWFSRKDGDEVHDPVPVDDSPLRLRVAVEMAIAFQFALTGLALVYRLWGTQGLYPTAALLGLVDMDALTVSMSHLQQGVSPQIAAQAIAIGVVMKTFLKVVITAVLGTGKFRAVTLRGLTLLGVALVLGLAVGWR